MADRRLRLLLPRQLRTLPADLAAIIAVVVLTDLSVLLPVVRETPLRIVFGLPFVLFVPGYAFIAALFPEAGTTREPDDAADVDANADGETETDLTLSSARDRGIDGIERVALSFGLSIAIVPLIGLVLNFTPWGIRLVPIIVSISGFTLIATGVAAVRRWDLPPDERFRVPYERWLAQARSELFDPDSRVDGLLNVLLALSIILAVSSVAYAVAVPKPGERFTEFYILTETEDGDLVADNYPTEFRQGQSRPVIIGIGNQEHRPMNYTVVVELQAVRVANNSTTVLEERELDRMQAAVAHNETWTQEYGIDPTMSGERLRLAFLLYQAEPPANPTVDNAYRELHLWINVTGATTEATATRDPQERHADVPPSSTGSISLGRHAYLASSVET